MGKAGKQSAQKWTKKARRESRRIALEQPAKCNQFGYTLPVEVRIILYGDADAGRLKKNANVTNLVTLCRVKLGQFFIEMRMRMRMRMLGG